MDSPGIRTILICGFLGAGKTTLLSYLLRDSSFSGKRIAVLVNEFGKLPVDGALLPEGDHYLAEINKGSIFCVCVKTDLIRDLEYIAREVKPEVVLIEATGLAEPGDFTSLLQTDYLRREYRRSATVCVADALNFPKLATIMPTVSAQVKVADVVLINKTDLAETEQVDEVAGELKKLNPGAKQFRTVNCEFPVGESGIMAGVERTAGADSGYHLCTEPPENTESCEIRRIEPLPKATFFEFLEKYRNQIIRGKGVVDFGGERRFVEVINGMVSVKPVMTDKIAPGAGTAMSLILRNLSALEFQYQLDKIAKNQA